MVGTSAGVGVGVVIPSTSSEGTGTGTPAGELFYIEGRPFTHVAKNAGVFTVGDMAINGFIDDNTFGKALAYKGGDEKFFAAWDILETI